MKPLFIIIASMMILASCSTQKVTSTTNSTLVGPQVTASARQLIRVTDDPVAEFQPSVSPDGSMLLYSIRDDNSDEGTMAGRWSLRLKKSISAPGFTPIIGNYTEKPSWINNDGDFLFAYYTSSPLIARSNINSLGITYVGQSSFGDYDSFASMSPDGEKIVLQSTIQDKNFICTVDTNGSNFTVLTEGSYPQWKPDGSKILYHKQSGDHFQLFELDNQSFQSTQITTGDSDNFYGKYSPGGGHIVFISTKDAGNEHLFIMNSSGRSITQLTLGKSKETQPDWGADGFIYFASTAGAKQPKKKQRTSNVEERSKRMSRRAILMGMANGGGDSKDKNKNKFSYDEYGYGATDIWRVKPVLRQ